MSIVILGSTGMLGSALLDFFDESEISVIQISRFSEGVRRLNQNIKFDINKDSVQGLVKKLPEGCNLINASGMIKHKIQDDNLQDIATAIKVNSLFPTELSFYCLEKNIRIFQIATDCVFSGNRGMYSESDSHDPVDIYGITKSLGENLSRNLMTLRCSMIGMEKNSNLGFLNWVVSQPKNAALNGYENHLWNGLTTLHVAKILTGIIDKDLFAAGTHHLVPRDSVSKLELMKEIAKSFQRMDVQINHTSAATAVDRRLITVNETQNDKWWKAAGYSEPISISEMVAEYFEWVNMIRLNNRGLTK